MRYRVVDCNCMLGGQMAYNRINRVENLLSIMDEKGIDSAVVFSASAKEIHQGANEKLGEILSSCDRLLPCFVALPHYTGECKEPAAMLDDMRRCGSRAVRIFPEHHRARLHIWLWKDLFDALCEKRIPLLIDFSNPNWSTDLDYDGVRSICLAYPDLPVVLMRASASADRYIYSMLDHCPNLYIDMSYYQPHRGIYNIVSRFSSGRLLYGSGLPEYEPDCALSAILNSGVGKEDMRRILAGNWERLWGEALL